MRIREYKIGVGIQNQFCLSTPTFSRLVVWKEWEKAQSSIHFGKKNSITTLHKTRPSRLIRTLVDLSVTDGRTDTIANERAKNVTRKEVLSLL